MVKITGFLDTAHQPDPQSELCIFFVDMAVQFGLRHSVFADGIMDGPAELYVDGIRKRK